MRREALISKKYIIKNKKIFCLRYLFIEIGNFYGIKVTYSDKNVKNKSSIEENEVILEKNSKAEILSFINILSENFSFPVELDCILEDLSCE